MCTRYNLTDPPQIVRKAFAVEHGETMFPPRYNIAPAQPVLIVRNDPAGKRELVLVRWGLIPAWSRDPAQLKAPLINARAETAAEKPSFRGPLRHRRCLVPATGYYEWTGKPGAKQPHLVTPRDGEVMGMAGLWEHWIGADGSEIETMAILTIASNAALSPLHDRMPVIIAPEDYDVWLDCKPGTAEPVHDLLRAPPEDLLHFRQVSRQLNSVRNEGADVLDETSTRLL